MNRAHTKSVLNLTILQKRVYTEPRIFTCQGTQVKMRTALSHFGFFLGRRGGKELHSSGHAQRGQQEKSGTLESRFEHSALATNSERLRPAVLWAACSRQPSYYPWCLLRMSIHDSGVSKYISIHFYRVILSLLKSRSLYNIRNMLIGTQYCFTHIFPNIILGEGRPRKSRQK